MDQLVIERKLDSLYRCIKRVEQRVPGTVEELIEDLDGQDVVVLNLTRAVQLCVDLGAHLLAGMDHPPPNTMGETFDCMRAAKLIEPDLAERLKKSVGFRNMAVHNYDVLNWAIVHAIATKHLSDFRRFAKAIAATLDS